MRAGRAGRAGRARWLALTGALALAGCVGGERPRDARDRGAAPPAGRVVIPVPAPAPLVRIAPPALIAAIDRLGRQFPGRVGIAVESVADGWTAGYGAAVRLPQQSVSKLWVALTVLDYRDAGRLRLGDPVTVTRDDLTLFHQPIAPLALREGGYATTVGDLLERALTTSDNTANDRLLSYVGGPVAVRDTLARKRLGDIRFGPGERLLQAGTAGLEWRPEYALGNAFAAARARLPQAARLAAYDRYVLDPPDGAAPAAIAGALARLAQGRLLSPVSTRYLLDTMEQSRTGRQRLRGAVPPGWRFGHKTGTGQDLLGRTAGYNDVGLLTAPDGRGYALAVMIGDTGRPIPERQQLMQAVVEAIVAAHAAPAFATTPYGSAPIAPAPRP